MVHFRPGLIPEVAIRIRQLHPLLRGRGWYLPNNQNLARFGPCFLHQVASHLKNRFLEKILFSRIWFTRLVGGQEPAKLSTKPGENHIVKALRLFSQPMTSRICDSSIGGGRLASREL